MREWLQLWNGSVGKPLKASKCDCRIDLCFEGQLARDWLRQLLDASQIFAMALTHFLSGLAFLGRISDLDFDQVHDFTNRCNCTQIDCPYLISPLVFTTNKHWGNLENLKWHHFVAAYKQNGQSVVSKLCWGQRWMWNDRIWLGAASN